MSGLSGEEVQVIQIVGQASEADWVSIAITVVSTMLGAFAGAWFAFLFEERREKRKELEVSAASGNFGLFCFSQIINHVANIESQHLRPWRVMRGDMFALMPIIAPFDSCPRFNLSELFFLLQSKDPNLLGEISVLQQRFDNLTEISKRRDVLHLHVQSKLAASGIPVGTNVDAVTIAAVIGVDGFQQLEDLTASFVEITPEILRDALALKSRLRAQLKASFPKRNFIDVSIPDEILAGLAPGAGT